LTNFNKRIITIEEGFLKTAKTVLFFEQAKDFLNRNIPTTPMPSANFFPPNLQIQPNLFNEFLNIESS
jgi:hypothetical protein